MDRTPSKQVSVSVFNHEEDTMAAMWERLQMSSEVIVYIWTLCVFPIGWFLLNVEASCAYWVSQHPVITGS